MNNYWIRYFMVIGLLAHKIKSTVIPGCAGTISAINNCVDNTDPCITSSDAFVDNTKTKAKTGITCTDWSLTTFSGSPEVIGPNVCSNPDDYALGPWCYESPSTTTKKQCYVDCSAITIPGCDNALSAKIIKEDCMRSTEPCRKSANAYRDLVKNITVSGQPCINWADSINPHNKAYVNEPNICSNPTGKNAGPWCYIATGGNFWNKCYSDACPYYQEGCVNAFRHMDIDNCQRHGSCATSPDAYGLVEKSTTVSGATCMPWSETNRRYSPDTRSNKCTYNNQGEEQSTFSGAFGAYCYSSDTGLPELCFPFCQNIGCSIFGCEEFDNPCFANRRFSYYTRKTTTITGRTCQAWADQVPHTHIYSNYSQAILSRCRNMDYSARGAWCYTTDPEVRREFCLETCHMLTDCFDVIPSNTTLLNTSDPCISIKTSYLGNKTTTSQGNACVRWSSLANTYSDGAGNLIDPFVAENYCRNPDEDPNGAWCYVAGGIKQYCFELDKLQVVENASVSSLYDPLGTRYDWKRIVADFLQTLGCLAILSTSGFTLFVFAVLKEKSIERFYHTIEELAMIASHVCIMLFRNETDNKNLCNAVTVILHFAYSMQFIFTLFEAMQSFTMLQNVITSGGLLDKKKSLALGIVFATVTTSVTTALRHQQFRTTWSCWLNYGNSVKYGSILPILSVSILAYILVESSTINPLPGVPMHYKPKKMAAIVNHAGLIVLIPLNLAAWMLGFLAIYYRHFPWYPTVFILNVSLAFVTFKFHALGNPKAEKFILKLWHKLTSKICHKRNS